MEHIDTQKLLTALNWRYATKKFDAARKIPASTWSALEQALVLSPSSYGLQPWKFLVVSNPEVREKLKAQSWDQAQVTEASHLVVLAAKTDLTEADVERFVKHIAATRGQTRAELQGYYDVIVGKLVKGPRYTHIKEWADRQTYIAFGQLMTSAALLGVDACPLEGLDPAMYDEILGLPAQGYHTLAACALGYRSPDDKYATKKKVRYPVGEVVQHV